MSLILYWMKIWIEVNQTRTIIFKVYNFWRKKCMSCMIIVLFSAVPNDKSFKTDDSDYSPSSPDNSDDEESCGNTKREIPEDILWAMFNTGVSFRSLSKLLELAFSLFNEKESYNFSYSYLFQKYKKLSIAKENAYKTRIQSENVFGTICFDHQKMQELSNKFASQKDRVGVVWHSEDSDRLIAVKEMPNKSGMSQALAILESCDEFNINVEQIVAVSCDNANTNVGHTSGTCSILEQRLHKPLLRLSCNHHITEIIIKDVYHHLFSTDAPNNLFYPILKEKWMQLREENFPYSPFEEDDFAENLHEFGDIIFDELKAKALASMRARLASPTIRDDYKELNILGMKFFGESFNNIRGNQVKFYALINPSNARFMGCAIQALKAFLFRDSLNWDTSERKKIKQNLQRFVIFVVLIYIPLWNSSNILFDAAINTITCLKNLEKYSQLEFQLASIAKSALSRHLIYLSEEISPLAIFSNKMSSEEKNGVAAKLTQLDSNNLPPRRIGPRQISNHIQYSEEIEFGECDQLNISQFIGERSHYLFNVMKIKTNFLQCPAELWPTDIEYLHAKNVISKTLVCVNDNSERAFSASKHRLNRQRCRNNDSYRRSMFATSYKQ